MAELWNAAEVPSAMSPENSQPVVSVLMLAFNHAPYLAEAIESVLKQEADFPIELLIGEDCSTDGTRAIALDYESRFPGIVRVITSPTNVGMHENHRRLVQASRGRYVAYCEGDDFWNVSDKLARQVEYLEERPGYTAVHSEFSHLIRSGAQWRTLARSRTLQSGFVPEGAIFESLLVRNFIQTCTLVARSAVVKQYMESPLSEQGYAVDDWPMCLFLSAHGGIGYINEPTATYRRIEGSATNRGAMANFVRVSDQLRMAREVGEYFGVDQRIVLESEATTMRALVGIALQAGDVTGCRSAVDWLFGHPRSLMVTLKLSVVRALLVTPGGPSAYRILARLRTAAIERAAYSEATGAQVTARSSRR